MSNKLYTEEEVRRFLSEIYMMPQTVDHCINELTPIKLPSDEEIDNASLKLSFDRVEFIKGAKWVLDKIQGGNNEH